MITQLLKDKGLGLFAKLVLLVAFMFPTKAFAHDFEVDGIYYNKTSGNEVAVTYKGDSDMSAAYSGDIVIPASVNYEGISYSVTSIGIGAFNSCQSLSSIEIPNSVTRIGRYALFRCSSLKEIIVNPLNRNFASYKGALYNKDMTELLAVPGGMENRFVIPASVITIMDYAFYHCSSLSSIEIPESVTSIGRLAFNGCKSLSSIEIPNSVTSIGEFAFDGCSSLSSIEIPNSVTSIETATFNGCESLSSIEIPNSVTSIESNAFYSCSSLSSIEIPNSVTRIGRYAFVDCMSLKKINVSPQNPNYVSSEGALYNKDMTDLICVPGGIEKEEFIIPGSVTSIEETAFYGCSSLISIEIPNSVTSIGNWTFNGCKSLSSIEIPASVTSIGYSAFGNCNSLSSIVIPASVTLIGNNAFYYCTALEYVVCLNPEPPVLSGILNSYKKIETLYVPAGSVEAYKQSENWVNSFNNILEYCDDITLEIEGEGKVYAGGYEIAPSGTKFSGGSFKFLILPDAGNYISAVTLDGNDVTGRMNEHNVWSLSGYVGNGTLKIAFAPITDTSLTVKGADSHSLTHYYKEGSSARIDLLPEAGWLLYSLAFNGEDVTGDVVDNSYTTPALSGNNNLELVMKQDNETGTDEINYAARKVSFLRNGNEVEVIGLDFNENIGIYDSEGKLEYQGTEHKVSLLPGNVYILRTERETLKFTF